MSPLDHAINEDENGTTLNGAQVWTGSSFKGDATATTCTGWTNVGAGDYGTIGSSSLTDSGWSTSGANECVVPAHLYCFEY